MSHNVGPVVLICEACYSPFRVYPYRAKTARFCSNGCRNARSETTDAYKHGKSYRMVKKNGRRQYESRIVTGAPTGTVVHHKDRNPRNNSLDNLQIMTRAEHLKEHGVSRWK